MKKKFTNYQLVWLLVFSVLALCNNRQASAYTGKSTAIQPTELETINSNNALPIPIIGTVVDQNNSPIPGATVIVVGTTRGTVTDIDGKFLFN